MRQSKFKSLLEAKSNAVIGFLMSWAVWTWVVCPLFGYAPQPHTGFIITSIFTVTSIARSYTLRRLFNRWK